MNMIEAIDLLSEMGVKGNIKTKDVMDGFKTLRQSLAKKKS